MFDIGWTEIVLAAVIALVVLGPRELPQALRLLGRWTRGIRQMAREFRNNFDLATDIELFGQSETNAIGGDRQEVPADITHEQKKHVPPPQKTADEKKSTLSAEKANKKSSDR